MLVACGNSDRQAPPGVEPPKHVEVASPQCKRGETTCLGDDVVLCEDGHTRRTINSCKGGCRQGACIETCAAKDVELIYLVDSDREFFSFDPKRLPGDPFKKVGVLSCDPRDSPFSMAVDRNGIAWVVYQSGYVYQVSIHDAHCFSEAAKPNGAPPTFGMGFVTDGPKATTEKLFVAGEQSGELATLDVAKPTLDWTRQGQIKVPDARSPELTGAADGKLYAYFPGEDNRGFVQELDRAGKVVGTRWSLPPGKGRVNAWAFAFWGDVFYVFTTFDNINEVHAIHRKTGKAERIIANSTHRIVGAGVSTCAPLLERAL